MINKFDEANTMAINKGGSCLSTKYIGSKIKMSWECDKQHQWDASFNSIQQGSWCPFCANNIKFSIADCCNIAKSNGGNCLSTKYLNNRLPLLWECSKQHQWEASFGNIKAGHWCPYCAGNNKNTLDDAKRLAVTKNGMCLSIQYSGAHTKMIWECSKLHTWEATYNHIRNGEWCPVCAKDSKKNTIELANALAKTKNGKCLTKIYVGNQTKMIWECENKHTWEATYNEIQQRSWCSECVRDIKFNDCVLLANSKCGEFISTKYVDSGTKYIWKCNNKHIWNATYNSIKHGTWCPVCSMGRTQKKLTNIVSTFLNEPPIVNYRPDWLKNPNTNRNLEIDIFFPIAKIAIEYNGIQHYQPIDFSGKHSVKENNENLKGIKERDKIKKRLIKSSGEIKHFIIFTYRNKIKKDNVVAKISKVIQGVI